MAAIAVGVIVVFALGALYVIRQSSGRAARPVGAFRRSRSDTAAPLLSDGTYESSEVHDDPEGGDSDASDDAGADSSDAGGDSGSGGDGGGSE